MSERKISTQQPAAPRWIAVLVGAACAVGAAGVRAQGASSLEEIVVTSSVVETPRRQIGAAVSVIDGGEIELRGYHSIADVLRTQPGISVTTSGGQGKTTSLRIRGEEAHRTLLVIDGVKSIDPSSTQAQPVFDSLLTTGDLERIEVLRGPQGFMYGADAGGVVNVITRRGEGDLDGRIGIEQGPFDTRKLDGSVAAGNEKGDFYVSITELDTRGFNAMTSDTVLADDDGAENTTVHAKLGLNAASNLRVQLVARDIDALTEYDGCFGANGPTHVCTGTIEQTTYRVSADHDGERLANRIAYSEIDIVRDDFADGELSFGTRGEIARFEYSGSYRPTAGTTIAYGVDFQDERMTTAIGTEQRDQRGYYAEYQGGFADRFYVSAGVRYDDNEDFGTHTSVRLSAAYVQDLVSGASLKYRASYGTGFRAPSLYEVAYNRESDTPPAADTVLREEQSRGYDVGVEYDGPGGMHVEITYFDQRVTDEIFFDLEAFSGYLQSTGTSVSKGVELAGRGIIRERWQLYGNWTYNDTRNTDDRQRRRRPRHLANVGVLYAALDDRLRISANYRISKDSIDIGDVALDDYGVLDLSAAYTLGERIELFGRIENASDREYEELIGYRTAGRSLYAGLRLRF